MVGTPPVHIRLHQKSKKSVFLWTKKVTNVEFWGAQHSSKLNFPREMDYIPEIHNHRSNLRHHIQIFRKNLHSDSSGWRWQLCRLTSRHENITSQALRCRIFQNSYNHNRIWLQIVHFKYMDEFGRNSLNLPALVGRKGLLVCRCRFFLQILAKS